MRTARRSRRALVAMCMNASLLAFAAASRGAGALPLVQIGNGPPQVDGSYLNATNLGQQLFFTDVNIVADSEVRYAEAVNIGTATFGTNARTITHTAPTLTVLGDVRIGTGNFIANASHASLSGSVRSVAGALIASPSRFAGSTATTIGVASNAADLQQAIWLTQASAGVSTVTAPFGSATSLVFDSDTELVLSGGLLSGSVAMNHASSRFEIHGHSFLLDSTPVGSGPITPLAGQLQGTLASGDPFAVGFTQGAPGQIELVSSIAVPLPGALGLGAAIGLGLLGSLALRRGRSS